MIGDIKKFRFWCQKVIPLVYDNSLSYYEVLCKVVDYLNKVIEDINEVPSYIDAKIDEALDDEHLKELMEQFIVDIEAAISSNNEGDNTNSSADYNIGQMLWWNGKLYKVIRRIDAGDTFIVNTNIELVNFEDLFNDFVDEVKHDITSNDDGGNTNASQNWSEGEWLWLNDVLYVVTRDITQGNSYIFSGDNINVVPITINEAIGNLATLNTTNKTNLVDAINEVLDNAGIYNKSTPDSGLTTNIGLKEGIYNVDSDLTIDAQLVVPKGAIINIASGATLTINGEILAGRYQIFDGDGDVVVNPFIQPVGYPEWFNDDVQRACDVFSKVTLAARNYFVDGDLVLTKQNFTLSGEVYGKYLGASYPYPSRLVFETGKLIIGVTDTASTNSFTSNITIENLAISVLSNGDCVSLYGVVRASLRHIYIDTANANCGIHCYMATGSHIEDVYVQSISVDHTFMGFQTTKDEPVSGGKPASVWFRNCTYANTGSPTSTNTYGFYVTDGSDIFIDSCETILADYGIAFVAMTTHTNVDFLISNCDFDGCKKRGIYFYNCTSNGAITIVNTYVAMHSSDANTYAIQFNNATIPVILHALQLLGNGTNTFGIAGTMHGIGSAIMRNVTTELSLTGDNDAKIDYIADGVVKNYPT